MCRESNDIERAGLVAAVEQAADGIVITDIDGKIRYVNPAFTMMTGYSGEEAVGQYTRILKSGRHSVAFYEELWNTIRSGRVWRGATIRTSWPRCAAGPGEKPNCRASVLRQSTGGLPPRA